jgi:hypothetical protein
MITNKSGCGETIRFTIYFLVLFSFIISLHAQTQHHPFLLVDSTKFQDMRDRKDTAPWSEMLASALQKYNNTPPINISSQTIHDCAYKMKDLTDAAALLYIIDSGNKEEYKNKTRDFLLDWSDMQAHSNYGKEWRGSVPVGAAFFASVLAYDVIYNDLTSEERSSIETNFNAVANDFYMGNNSMSSWILNRWGASGTWYIFKNNSRKQYCINEYRKQLFWYINKDGVFQNSIGYAHGRLSSYGNIAKTHFMDVLEFTAEDNSYYANPRMQNFYHWLYSLAITPNGQHPTFGDSGGGTVGKSNPAIFRAHKFSSEAGEVAAWRINRHGGKPIGGLINYVLLDQPLPAGMSPMSKIYPDGGAFFIEKDATNNSFYAALWNPKDVAQHGHKDINAVHLCAYGEHIIKNSGYNGWGKGYGDFSWTDIYDRAWTNSVVLINNFDLNAKKGNGIVEGFTTEKFDYACGDAGPAIYYSGSHFRNLIMVHPQDGQNGYFVLFDEVDAYNSSRNVNVLIHPNSDIAQTVSANKEYRWEIYKYNQSSNNTRVNVFLASEPLNVKIKDGPLCNLSESIISQYINAEYTTDEAGKRNIVTVIFPHDKTHSKATMSRKTDEGFSGAEVVLSSSIKDYALESSGNDTITLNGVSFRGLAALYRTGANEDNFYFVRQGRYFKDGGLSPKGFVTDEDVSLYIKSKNGNIVSDGADVTLYYPDIKGIKIDGSPVTNISAGSGWVEVNVPAGVHAVELSTEPVSVKQTAILAETFDLQQNYPNPFNAETQITYRLPEPSEVTLEIYNMLGNKVRTLISSKQSGGIYNVPWNAMDDYGRKVASGIYMYRIHVVGRTKIYTENRKMLLLK